MRKTLLISSLSFLLCATAYGQKGQKSISAGVLVSQPHAYGGHTAFVKTGFGAEVAGLYQLTERGGIQLQVAVTDFRNRYFPEHWTVLSTKAGYRHQFGPSRLYLHGSVGPEFDLAIGDPLVSLSVGAGKRFAFKHRFLDAGIDYVAVNTEPRINLKLAYGLVLKQKRKQTDMAGLLTGECF